VDEVCKGFSLKFNINLMANLKKLVFEQLLSQESIKPDVSLLAIPLILFKVSGNLNLEFDELNELK
jgi:hypothetical protein